jgi:hypothetical protein
MAPIMCGEPASVKLSFVNGRIAYQQAHDGQYGYLVEEVRKSIAELKRHIAILES